jgi:hypothetical protein
VLILDPKLSTDRLAFMILVGGFFVWNLLVVASGDAQPDLYFLQLLSYVSSKLSLYLYIEYQYNCLENNIQILVITKSKIKSIASHHKAVLKAELIALKAA